MSINIALWRALGVGIGGVELGDKRAVELVETALRRG